MQKQTIKGSNKGANYFCIMEDWLFVMGRVGKRERSKCNALISFLNLCVDGRKAWRPKTVVSPLLRAVIKAT